MTLTAVNGGWVNTDFDKEYPATYHRHRTMITQERKSKYKHKITIAGPTDWTSPKDDQTFEMRSWCEQSYGPGGRKQRWRFGWTQKDSTFYFRSSKDAMMFTLRWSS